MALFFAIPMKLRADYRYCRQITQEHVENFPVASLLAPRHMRHHLHAVYAFARLADDFADMPGRSQEERLRLLDDWERRLELARQGEPDHPVFRAVAHTLATTGLPADLLGDLLEAFRQDVIKKQYGSYGELLDYCRFSANPVGRIVLYLAGQYDEEQWVCSDAICTALQLVNHWQDLGQDACNGRPLYLPEDEMALAGVNPKMVAERRFSPEVGELILSLVDRTRELFQAGEPLLQSVPWPLNLELAVTWEAGVALLNMIEEQGGDTLRSRPSLSLPQWAGCFRRAVGHVLA